MGYYINILIQGEMYELDGQKLLFIEKKDKRYYFYLCKKEDWGFDYFPTEEKLDFTIKEIHYIKRVQDLHSFCGLQSIGKEKVFPRY